MSFYSGTWQQGNNWREERPLLETRYGTLGPPHSAGQFKEFGPRSPKAQTLTTWIDRIWSTLKGNPLYIWLNLIGTVFWPKGTTLASFRSTNTHAFSRTQSVFRVAFFYLGKGHSSHVTNVKWSCQDKFLFSTGGEDNCVFQWTV